MPDPVLVTITELPNAAALDGTERVPMDQGGVTKDASTQQIADLAAGTDLDYNQATRTLSSSTGDDVTLPLATDELDGLMSAAQRLLTQALIGAGVQVSGTAVVLPHIHGDLAGSVYIHVRNTSGGQLTKGTPVRVVGSVGNTTTLEVAAADSASAGTMPAIGILADTLAVNAEGHATVAGELTGLSTSGYSIGQALYVAAGGGLTGTRPTTGTVQKVAIAGRVNDNTGSITATITASLNPVAYSGAYGDLSGRPTIPAAADAAPQPLGTAAIGASTDYAREDHVHAMPSAGDVGADPAGTASAAISAHVAAADPHTQLALAGAISSSRLTMTAGLLGRESGTGAPQVYTIGSGLAIVGGALVVTAGGTGTVTSVGLSMPTGFAVANSPVTTSGTLAVTFAAGYNLPTTASQSNWDTAYDERLRWDGSATGLVAATGRTSLGLGNSATRNVGTTAGTVAAGDDARLSDAREWTAATIGQPEAEAGTSTTRRAFTAQRVFQAIASWWTGASTAAGRALVTAVDAAAQRTSLGLGGAAVLNVGTTAGTVAAGDDARFHAAVTLAASVADVLNLSGQELQADDPGADRLLFWDDSEGKLSHATLGPGITLVGTTIASEYVLGIACSDETTDLTVGTAKVTFRMPFAATLTAVRANVNTAPTDATLVVDLNEEGTTVLSTKLSIDATEKTSVTAAVPAVISDAALADDAEMTIDIDQVGATAKGKGLKVWLYLRRV